MKKTKKIIVVIAIVLVLLFGASAIYLGIYEKPIADAVQIAETMERNAKALWFEGNTQLGYLIYPGGKVDERAYAPLAQLLASQGDTVVIARMPFRLAILDSGRAASIMDAHPEVSEWVMIGHSLGGTAASMYIADHPQRVSGMVFLASYPYKDLSVMRIACLSILGSHDSVLDMEKYTAAKAFFPEDTTEIVIDGGNHSNFGTYGLQNGDTPATITAEEQQKVVADAILEMPASKHNIAYAP